MTDPMQEIENWANENVPSPVEQKLMEIERRCQSGLTWAAPALPDDIPWLISQMRHLRQLVYAQELPEGWHEADDASVQLAVDNAELRQQVERLRTQWRRVYGLANQLNQLEWARLRRPLTEEQDNATRAIPQAIRREAEAALQSARAETPGDSGEVQTNRNGEEE